MTTHKKWSHGQYHLVSDQTPEWATWVAILREWEAWRKETYQNEGPGWKEKDAEYEAKWDAAYKAVIDGGTPV